MNYTLYPIAPHSFDFFGVVLLSFIACTVIVFLISFFEGYIHSKLVLTTIISCFLSICVIIGLFISDHNSRPLPKNEVVCGKRVDFSTDMVGGKSKSLAGFVQYEMCDGSGIITIRANEKIPYPEQLNFYKN